MEDGKATGKGARHRSFFLVLPWYCVQVATLVMLSLAWRGYIAQGGREVVVVGAGISGASAASALQELGYRVRVVEARNRTGGRIFTNLELGYPIDLGAAFIHRPAGNPMRPLAERHRVETVPFQYRNCTYFDGDGSPVSPERHEKGFIFFENIVFNKFFEEWEDGDDDDEEEVEDDGTIAEEEGEGFLDQSMWMTLHEMGFYNELPEEDQRLFDTFCFQYLVQDLQSDLTDISTRQYDQSLDPGEVNRTYGVFRGQSDLFVSGGFGKVVDALLHGVTVDLNVPVREIVRTPEPPVVEAASSFVFGALSWVVGDWAANVISEAVFEWLSLAAVAARAARNEPQIEVRTEKGQNITCDYAVITLPIGVLKKQRVNFIPQLPLHVANLVADLGVSSTLKVGACWKPESVFWPSGTGYSTYFHKYPSAGGRVGRFGQGDFVEVVNLLELSGAPCLLLEVETELAEELSRSPRDKIVARLMKELRLMFGGNATPPDAGVTVSDWATSPFSDGGLVHWRVDTETVEGEVFEYPVSSQLFWAGEHTLWQYYGNTHGAYLSGSRAARQIAASRSSLAALLGSATLSLVLSGVTSFRTLPQLFVLLFAASVALSLNTPLPGQ